MRQELKNLKLVVDRDKGKKKKKGKKSSKKVNSRHWNLLWDKTLTHFKCLAWVTVHRWFLMLLRLWMVTIKSCIVSLKGLDRVRSRDVLSPLFIHLVWGALGSYSDLPSGAGMWAGLRISKDVLPSSACVLIGPFSPPTLPQHTHIEQYMSKETQAWEKLSQKFQKNKNKVKIIMGLISREFIYIPVMHCKSLGCILNINKSIFSAISRYCVVSKTKYRKKVSSHAYTSTRFLHIFCTLLQLFQGERFWQLKRSDVCNLYTKVFYH